MWNFLPSNRLLDQRIKRQAYRKHKNALQSMKSQVNNQPPQSFTFLWTKPKQRQMLIELETDIDNKNKYLVRRMLSARSECSSRKRGLKLKDSLIKDHSRRVSCEIDSENKKLLERLKSATSLYSRGRLQKSHRQYMKLKGSLNHSKMDTFYDFSTEKTNARPLSARQ